MSINLKALNATLKDYENYPIEQQRIELPKKHYNRKEFELITLKWYTKGSAKEIIQSGSRDFEEILEIEMDGYDGWPEIKEISNCEVIKCVNLWFWYFWKPQELEHLIVEHSNETLKDFDKYLLYQYYQYCK